MYDIAFFKDSLFNPMLGKIIELAYWFVKFVGDYRTLFLATQEVHQKNKNEKFLISKTTASLIKFSRYFVKFIDNYQNLINQVKKGIIAM